MSKQDILDYFSDINYAYNDSARLDTLSRMLEELVEQAAPRWEDVEDGVYAVKDGVVYKMEVKTPEGKTVKLPRIRLTDAMRYEPPKEE